MQEPAHDEDPLWICPSCGEENEADLGSLALNEVVVVDCRICCRPSRLHCERDAEGLLTVVVRES